MSRNSTLSKASFVLKETRETYNPSEILRAQEDKISDKVLTLDLPSEQKLPVMHMIIGF